jgi:aerobic carbon-monoxide dehydrogenase medium subunit
MLYPFRLLTPTTVSEATAELLQHGDDAQVYAGGAELVLLMRNGLLHPEYLVDIKRIPWISDVRWDGRAMRLGAAATHRRLETDPVVREHLPVLADAETQVGNVRVRSQGTIGGNLCFADPHADPGTALLVHDAFALVAGSAGTRRVALDDFLVGTYETDLEQDELLTEIEVEPLPAGWGGAFLRVERFYRPTANVAVALHRDDDGHVDAVRLAVGCVGPRSMRLPELEEGLRGASLDEARKAIAAAKPYLRERLEPVYDLLGSAAYKVHIVSVLLARALDQSAAAPS